MVAAVDLAAEMGVRVGAGGRAAGEAEGGGRSCTLLAPWAGMGVGVWVGEEGGLGEGREGEGMVGEERVVGVGVTVGWEEGVEKVVGQELWGCTHHWDP